MEHGRITWWAHITSMGYGRVTLGVQKRKKEKQSRVLVAKITAAATWAILACFSKPEQWKKCPHGSKLCVKTIGWWGSGRSISPQIHPPHQNPWSATPFNPNYELLHTLSVFFAPGWNYKSPNTTLFNSCSPPICNLRVPLVRCNCKLWLELLSSSCFDNKKNPKANLF